MSSSPFELVFNAFDFVDKILTDGKFSYPELQALQLVNKTFNNAAKRLYDMKYRIHKNIFYDVFKTQMEKCLNASCTRDHFRHSAALLVQINEFCLWPFLVHDPDMAEPLFLMWGDMHPFRNDMPRTSLTLYDKARFEFSKYVLFEDVSFMTIKTMRRMVSFKGIRGAWTMSKRKLVENLKRPENHLYYYTST
jgi:hypothetical protein